MTAIYWEKAMTVRVKDLDGARYVNVEKRGEHVFMWGRGFAYTFDLGIVLNAMRKEFNVEPIQQDPPGLESIAA